MGVNIQSSASRQVLRDFTSVVNESSSSVIQSESATCASGNIFNINIGGKECDGTVVIEGANTNIDQDSANGCKINQTNGAKVTDQNTTTIKTAAQQFIQNQLDSDQGWLAIGLSVQTTTNVSKQDIQTRIDNIAKENIEQSCSSYISSYNMGNLDICADVIDSTINLTQKSEVTALSQCSNTTILNNFFNTQELQEFAQNTDNYFKSTQEGPLSGAENIIRIIIIAAAILVGLLIIGGIIFAVIDLA